MYNCVLRSGLVAAGVVLAWSLGCQMDGLRSPPGALPTGAKSDLAPRLNASTYFAHAHLLERQGRFEQAAQQYRKALELRPGFLSARNRLGITLNKRGRHAEASAEFRLAIEQSPTVAYLHNNLGFSLYLQGRYDEASITLQRAIELRPDFRRAHMNHGLVLGRLGRYDEALIEFSLAASQAEAHYNVALIQTEAGDFAEAARSLEMALHLGPDFDVAREQLRVVARLAAEAELRAQPAVAQVDDSAEAPSVALTSVQTPPAAVPRAESVAANAEQQGGAPAALAPLPDADDADEFVGPPVPENAWLARLPGPFDMVLNPAEISAMFDELVAAALENLQATYDQILCELEQYLDLTATEAPP